MSHPPSPCGWLDKRRFVIKPNVSQQQRVAINHFSFGLKSQNFSFFLSLSLTVTEGGEQGEHLITWNRRQLARVCPYEVCRAGNLARQLSYQVVCLCSLTSIQVELSWAVCSLTLRSCERRKLDNSLVTLCHLLHALAHQAKQVRKLGS